MGENGQVTELSQVPALRTLLLADVEQYESAVGHSIPEDVWSDIRLARFVNAYDGDLEGAAKAYRKMLQWRRTSEVDKLRNDMMPSLDELRQTAFPHWEVVRQVGDYGPWYHSGECHEGDLVHLEVVGKLDPSLLIETVTEQKILQHQIGFFEARARVLDDLSNEHGRLVRTLQIRDLSNFGLHLLQHAKALGIVSSIMKAGTENFPECTRKSIFICTPMSFYAVWKTISGVLRKKTQDKVVFLRNDYHRELLKYVGASAIHRLEKMKAVKEHAFVEKGAAEDHLPLEYVSKVCVSAGKTDYYPIWMSRDGPRKVAHVKIFPREGSSDGKPEAITLNFVASHRPQGSEEAVLIDLSLPIQGYARGSGEWEVNFPLDVPDDIASGFLLVNFDNSASWVYSISVPIEVTFKGET